MGRPGVSGPGAVGVGGPQGPISRGGKAGARVRLFFVPHYKGARYGAGALTEADLPGEFYVEYGEVFGTRVHIVDISGEGLQDYT